MKKLFTIAAVIVFCACFAAAQIPGAIQPSSTAQQAGTDQVLKPVLEFANDKSAKIAWTSKAGADLDLHYGTDLKKLQKHVSALHMKTLLVEDAGISHSGNFIGRATDFTNFLLLGRVPIYPARPTSDA